MNERDLLVDEAIDYIISHFKDAGDMGEVGYAHVIQDEVARLRASIAPAEAKGDAPWRAVGACMDAKALATAQEIAHMWGQDRSQFVSRIQVAVLDAMAWMGSAQAVAPQPADGGAVAPVGHVRGIVSQGGGGRFAAIEWTGESLPYGSPLYAHPPAAQVHGEAVTWSGDERAAIAELMKAQGLSESSLLRQSMRLYQSDWQRRRNGETCVWSGDEKRARDFAGPITHPDGDALGVVRELPDFLETVADELEKRDTLPGTFAVGVAESLRGRAIILRKVSALQHRGEGEG